MPGNAKFCPECGQAAPKPEAVQEKEDEILTVLDVMKLLKISRNKLYEMVRNNEIPWFPIGSDKRFIRADILAFARNQYSEKFKDKFHEAG
jgi:excisionase family DNA binding protein